MTTSLGHNVDLAERAYRVRRNALRMGEVQGQGYIAQALDIADVLATAYFHAMKYRPEDPHWEDRDRFHAMSTAEELRALVMDALFVFNLADLSDMLERCYGLPEAAFWRRLRGAIDRHIARHGLAGRQAVFQPFARRVAAESLLTRAIRPGRGACSHEISNAISNALAR